MLSNNVLVAMTLDMREKKVDVDFQVELFEVLGRIFFIV
jgi:hypothetical protein